VLQCVAVCCNVLQCVAVTVFLVMLIMHLSLYVLRVPEHMYCNVLQCVAECCSVLQQYFSRHADTLPPPVRTERVRKFVLQCVAVCCSKFVCGHSDPPPQLVRIERA